MLHLLALRPLPTPADAREELPPPAVRLRRALKSLGRHLDLACVAPLLTVHPDDWPAIVAVAGELAIRRRERLGGGSPDSHAQRPDTLAHRAPPAGSPRAG